MRRLAKLRPRPTVLWRPLVLNLSKMSKMYFSYRKKNIKITYYMVTIYLLRPSWRLIQLWVRLPLRRKNYLIFSFLRSGNKATGRIEFHNTTRGASRIRPELGNGSVLMKTGFLSARIPGFLCLPCYATATAWTWKKSIYLIFFIFLKCYSTFKKEKY